MRRGSIVVWILVVLFLLGAASFVYGVAAETAARDSTNFALLTVTFLYLLGISQAGVVFSAIMRLVKAQWAKPWYRFAELATMAYFPFAIVGFLVIFAYGREELFYWLQPQSGSHLSPWLDIDWLLIRNLGGLLLFYGLSAIYVYTALLPDLGRQEGSVDAHTREQRLFVLSPFVLAAFVLSNTLIAWDFAMMLVPHFHSTVFPIHYWFGNVFAGSAALVVFVLLDRRSAGPSVLGTEHIRNLGMLLTGYTLLWLYFFWAQFFVIWYGNLPFESEPIWRQMYGHYGPYFWSMLAGCFFVPFAAFIFAAVKRSLFAMSVIAVAINVGVWLNKYLMIVPVFSPADRPFDNWLDIAVSFGVLAGFAAVLAIALARIPKYSHWEMDRSEFAEAGGAVSTASH